MKDSDGFEVLMRNLVTESQSKKLAEDQGDRILMKMSELFRSMETLGSKMDSRVSNLENQVREGFGREGRHRKQENEDLEKRMVMRMEDGLLNEECARQNFQKEMAVMKDEIKNLRVGSGSTVCGDASTGIGLGSGTIARPPTLISRWNEMFIPRRMDFKGWFTDYTKSSIQGITDVNVLNLVSDVRKWFHGMPTSGLTGTRPRKNKGHGWPRRWSVCGSKVKRAW